jgi:hypothetical protein
VTKIRLAAMEYEPSCRASTALPHAATSQTARNKRTINGIFSFRAQVYIARCGVLYQSAAHRRGDPRNTCRLRYNPSTIVIATEKSPNPRYLHDYQIIKRQQYGSDSTTTQARIRKSLATAAPRSARNQSPSSTHAAVENRVGSTLDADIVVVPVVEAHGFRVSMAGHPLRDIP